MLDAHEIIPGLWQGSLPPRGSLVALEGFDTLVLTAVEYQFSSVYFPGVEVIRAPNEDAGEPLTHPQLQVAVWAAKEVVKRLQAGEKVLVTCAQGINRSGLVVALTLHFLHGWPGRICIQAVRLKRKPRQGHKALTNPYFVQALERLPGIDTSDSPLAV